MYEPSSKLVDDVRRHEGLLDLYLSRLQRLSFAAARQPLGEATEKGVAGHFFEHRLLDRILRPEAGAGTHDNAQDEADYHEQQNGGGDAAELLGWDPGWYRPATWVTL